MPLIVSQKPQGQRPASAGTTRDWMDRFERTAKASNWVEAHSWNVDLRTMEEVAANVREKLRLSPTDRLLDVGCGTGGFLSLLLHPGQHGFGFDLSEALLRRGIDGESVQQQVHCGAADGTRLPLVSDSFDKIVCYGVLQCLPDANSATRLVQELVRVCRPGGTVFIGDVSGVLEKHRQTLSRFGIRERTVDSLITAAIPLWGLRRRWKHETPSHLYVRRSLFRRAVAGLHCEVHFRTFGARPRSRNRFDVIIHKTAEVGEAGRTAAQVTSGNGTPPITLDRFDAFEQLLPLRAQWDSLALRIGADLFSSFEWCATWWKHFHDERRAELFVARNTAGDIVGFVPMYRETVSLGPWCVNVVRMMGSCDASTRTDLVVEPDFLPAVFREVSTRLGQTDSWDIIHVGDLPGAFAHGRDLARALQGGQKKARVVHRTGYYPNSIFDIPDSFGGYLQQLSPNERSSIRRTERRLFEDHGAVIQRMDQDSLEPAFEAFRRQHEAWWARSGRLGYFRDWPGCFEFHLDYSRQQAATGRLHFLRLAVGGEPVGFYYGQRYGRRIHWFSGSRSGDPKWDPYSPGRQLHCAMVREAIAHGVTQIDGMNGYYEFKKRWGARYTQLQNVTVFSQEGLARLAIRDFRSASRLHSLYHRLLFWHVAPWLRKRLPESQSRWLCQGQTKRFVRSRFMEYAADEQADDAVCYLAP